MDYRTRRVYRVAADLTQAEMAEAVGISQSHFSEIEHGKVNPNNDLKQRIADKLNTTPDALWPAESKAAA